MCGPWRLSQRAVCLSAQLCLAYFATSVCSGTATTKHFIYLYLKNLTWILSLSKLKKVKHQDALFLDDVMLVLLGIQLIIMQKSLLIRNISFSVLISHTCVYFVIFLCHFCYIPFARMATHLLPCSWKYWPWVWAGGAPQNTALFQLLLGAPWSLL